MMASFVSLLLKQAEQQAKIREGAKPNVADSKPNDADKRWGDLKDAQK